MQEQNFEKQVKQKMEELSVAPSAPVWMKVEEQIRQKRSRRRVFFWLFPIGFLLAGLITWSVMQNNDNPVAGENSNIHESISSQKKTIENTTEKSLRPESIEEQNPGEENKTNHEPGTTTVNSPRSVEKPFVKPGNKPSQPSQINVLPDNNNNAIGKNNKNNVISAPAKNDLVLQENKTQTDVQHSDNTVLSDLSSDSATTSAVASSETMPPAEENKIAESKKPAAKARWTISPYLSMGVSSIQYHYGIMDKNATQFNASPSSPGIGSGFPTMPTAAEPTSGFSFNAGVKFMKPLNKRLDLSMGGGYYYASTKIRVGPTVEADTMFGSNFSRSVMVDQYYRSGNTKKYTNRYHFVEIPLAINWQVNKNIPLEWETGISVAQLIASNALTFDGSGNYYENKKLLYRTQFVINSSLTYRLFSIKEKTFHAGPYMKYHLTQMEKNNSGQYLFSAGLGMKLNF